MRGDFEAHSGEDAGSAYHCCLHLWPANCQDFREIVQRRRDKRALWRPSDGLVSAELQTASTNNELVRSFYEKRIQHWLWHKIPKRWIRSTREFGQPFPLRAGTHDRVWSLPSNFEGRERRKPGSGEAALFEVIARRSSEPVGHHAKRRKLRPGSRRRNSDKFTPE